MVLVPKVSLFVAVLLLKAKPWEQNGEFGVHSILELPLKSKSLDI